MGIDLVDNTCFLQEFHFPKSHFKRLKKYLLRMFSKVRRWENVGGMIKRMVADVASDANSFSRLQQHVSNFRSFKRFPDILYDSVRDVGVVQGRDQWGDIKMPDTVLQQLIQ